MKINSMTDVITNSSTSVFVVYAEHNIDSIKELPLKRAFISNNISLHSPSNDIIRIWLICSISLIAVDMSNMGDSLTATMSAIAVSRCCNLVTSGIHSDIETSFLPVAERLAGSKYIKSKCL